MDTGLIVCIILCTLVLVVLFFPFTFWFHGSIDERGAKASGYFFKKKFFEVDHPFGQESQNEEIAEHKTSVNRDHAAVSGEEHAAVPSQVDALSSGKEPQEELPEENVVASPATPAGPVPAAGEEAPEKTIAEVPPEVPLPQSSSAAAGEGQPAKDTDDPPAEDSQSSSTLSQVGDASIPQGKKEKRSLTDTEFWTILLTPEFDSRAWWAVKKFLAGLCKLCHLKFFNCFVEGIRSDYARMGELASLNAFLKSYPYIGDWDFRMDWTMDHEPYGEGHLRLQVNLCRLLGLFLIFLFYGGMVLLSFWRRRSQVLKTNELPELGWIRTKIVKMMAEE